MLLLCLVALSGAASLTYELLWIRALGRHFGTSTPAITTVVATFMAGLGLGYVWFGARADRSPQPFRLYQRIELCIALTGLGVSLFLLRGGAGLDLLARLCAAAGPLAMPCTVLVLALLMLVPTIAMGGTVPVLASALGRHARPAQALSLLYASNTLGAIAGALGPDFLIIPRWGMTPAAWLAAATNLFVAALAQRYVRSEQSEPVPESPQLKAADRARNAAESTLSHDVTLPAALTHDAPPTAALTHDAQQTAALTHGAQQTAALTHGAQQAVAFTPMQAAALTHDAPPTAALTHDARRAATPALVREQDSLEAAELRREAGVARFSPQRAAALVLSACSGFCALGLEVLWSRTLQHWAAALVTSFAVLLAVYLAALALGALLTERLAVRVRWPLMAACALTALTGLSAILPLWAAPAWRDLARAWWPRPPDIRRVGLVHEAIDALLHASFLELAPCLLMGATFPFIATAWLADDKTGARSGQLFVVNTLAGTLGSLVVGFWWLPELGEQSSYAALALLFTSVAALCTILVARSERAYFAAVSAALCFAGVLALTLLLPASQLFRAHFRSGGHVFAVEEGTTTTAAAATRFLYGEPHYIELLTPGTSMSSTHPGARRYMSMMAHAAMFTAHQPERALLICYGVGNTAHALLAHPGLKRLDIVDTSAEVLALSRHFAAARGKDPLRDPRSHVFIDDGRHHLVTRDARYDVITAEPPPPNHAGVTNLYSREFYRLARTRLSARGVLTQWLPVFQLSDDDVRGMIAAFVAEFPHTALLYGVEEQLVLIGSAEPIQMRPRADEALTRELRSSYIGGIEDVTGSIIQRDADLRELVRGVEPLSDEHPSIQYPREDVPTGTFFTKALAHDPMEALSLLPSDVSTELRERTQHAAAATLTAVAAIPLLRLEPAEVRELSLGARLGPLLAEHPHDQGLWGLLSVDSERARLAERALSRPGASELIKKPLAQLNGAERAHFLVLQDAQWMLARRAFYARDYTRALELFQRLRPEHDDVARRWLFIAGCTRALGRAAESAEAFTEAAAASGDKDFRTTCTTLAAHASQAVAPADSPWSLSP